MPKIPGNHKKLGERQWTDSASQLSEGTNLADTWISDSKPSECDTANSCFSQPPSLWYSVVAALMGHHVLLPSPRVTRIKRLPFSGERGDTE